MDLLFNVGNASTSQSLDATARLVIAKTSLLGTAATVRLKLQQRPGNVWSCYAAIGLRAASGDAYDIDPATLVILTSGGNQLITVSNTDATTMYTDPVAFAVDGLRDVVISIYRAGGTMPQKFGAPPTGLSCYRKGGNYAYTADVGSFATVTDRVDAFNALEGEGAFGFKVLGELVSNYGIYSDHLVAEVEAKYHIPSVVDPAPLVQRWGLKLGADLVQPWSDAPVIKSNLFQPYGNAGVLTAALLQRWRDMVALRARLDQPWAIMESLLAALEQPWALTSGPIQALLDQGWHVRDIEQVAAVLHQPWAIAADGAVLRYTVDVSADGQPVRVSHINIEADLGQDVLTAEIHPETEAEYLLCPFGAALQITVTSAAGTESFSFVVTSPRISEQHGDTRYIVEAMSPAAILGEPYAAPVEGELSGRASVIAAALAGSIPLAWQTVDWAIPAAAWIASGETPLALLKQLAAAVGAVVQSRPDGSLVVQPAYPVSLPAWPAASPDLTLTETIDCFSTGSTPDHRPGYNRYLVSNQGSAADSLRLEESAISTTTKEVRGYQVPWDGFFDLTHTGGDWVVVEPLAIEERQETETVEFVAGAGRVRYPLYGVVAAEWQQTNLGTITTSEDGGLTSAIAGQSLLAITYTTRCRLWRVRDGQNEQLQLVAEVA